MDMFGSSDEESETPMAQERSPTVEALCNVVFTVLMKAKPKSPIVAAHDSTLILDPEIAVVSKVDATGGGLHASDEDTSGLLSKLAIGKVRRTERITADELASSTDRKYDIIVCLFEPTSAADADTVEARLMPGGTLLYFAQHTDGLKHLQSDVWAVEASKIHVPVITTARSGTVPSDSAAVVVEVRMRPIRINQAGALYWPGLRTAEHIAQERANVESICVCLTAQEAALGIFSTVSHERAVRVIQEHGVCIFPQLHTAQDVRAWSEAGRTDMNLAIQRLRVQYHVDLLADAEEVSMDNIVKDNFHELSMREAYRCDLRNSPRMTQMHAHLPKQLDALGRAVGTESSKAVDKKRRTETEKGDSYVSAATSKAALASTTTGVGTGSNAVDPIAPPTTANRIAAAFERCLAARRVPTSATAVTTASASATPELRYHRGLVGALTEIMNPVPASLAVRLPSGMFDEEVNLEHGNWGKWNFSGPGPSSFNHPCIGKMGVVVSLPGCKDQTIHADTAHIFEHTHLPPHYLNLFLPCAGNETIGSAALKPVDAQRRARLRAAIEAQKAANKNQGEPEEEYVDEEETLRELIAAAEKQSVSSECFYQGQTAFVLGSHRMEVAAVAMTHPDAQPYLESRFVRPQLSTGDGLIFDCRILHFGLSNWGHLKAQPATEKDWRMMMYVNYHQQWFLDPKNWNDNKKLF